MGIYTEAEVQRRCFRRALKQIPNDTATAFWHEIGEGPYNPTVTKATHLRDPFHRYFHRVLAHTIAGRGEGTAVCTVKDLFFLYCLVHQKRCNLAYALALFFTTCTGSRVTSRICGGSYITQLAHSFEFMTDDIIADLTVSDRTTTVNKPMLVRLKLVNQFRELGWRFIRANGGPWRPEEREEAEPVGEPGHAAEPDMRAEGGGVLPPDDLRSRLDRQDARLAQLWTCMQWVMEELQDSARVVGRIVRPLPVILRGPPRDQPDVHIEG
ncbi:hypothetical protein HanPI659440_Chr04g0153161 [Helianthus annuus]|nr:hypothetical protein HanPI659440_Chr04g0153161 [Helianthus annuus]